MASQFPAASARPDIISLDVLLKDVDEGRVQIPKFQRPYVWSPQMKRELFQSVLSGYPIGSLLFWEPRDITVQTMDRIGPIAAPASIAKNGVSLVLDGHQRLATLYGVLRHAEGPEQIKKANQEQLSWLIGYDLEKEETRQMRLPEDFSDPRVLPLRAVLRTAEWIKFARLLDAQTDISDEKKAIYLDRADAIQRAIRDYRIALTIMRDGNVDDAVAIFSLINRSGKPMTSDQMAVALTYQEGFNLEDALDYVLGELDEFGFGDISRTVALQSLLHGAKKNFVKPNFDNLRQENTRDALKNAVPEVAKSLRESAKFLNKSVGFHTAKLLPYALQLFLLGVFFRVYGPKPLSTEFERALIKWFWATSFEGWFASANSSDIEKAVRAMETFANSEGGADALKSFEAVFIDRPLKPFPRTFDRRSARIRAMLLVQIVRTQLVDPITGDDVDGSDLMADPNRRDLPYVFRPAGNMHSRSPANRILLPRSHGSAVRDHLVNSLAAEDALSSFSINEQARDALKRKNLDDFVRAREAELGRHEEEFLAQFSLHIGEDIERSDDEIDIDED
ncbi:GmrSD restriction endonuclease domain-containing protein [Oceanibaculum indicum]|uniref:Uncharacterized protein DUF262 n=1 Tax=Oceanibaculum indicum TaxID=526216 RepID=A0A420WA25_9PROT|nr:DUF262 domain-containing protein [Oceanibaculum indicum]RKQ64145.1 uncharacterized protein DUF262 [Oceanibaculum indicum]